MPLFNFWGSALDWLTSTGFLLVWGGLIVTKFFFPLLNSTIGDATGLDWLFS